MSKSGMEIRSGFKNLSNKSPYSRGSSSVILKPYATIEPAPLPRPGPNIIPLSLPHFIKSDTIKKYPEKPIRFIISSSYSALLTISLGSCFIICAEVFPGLASVYLCTSPSKVSFSRYVFSVSPFGTPNFGIR